jgi:hypothetical protein
MESLNETLAQHVDDVIESHHHKTLLTTTGTRTAVYELLERNDGLEQAVRELAAEVQRLAAIIEPTDTR